jgi:transcriptional regulator GlxA family with amidase domain
MTIFRISAVLVASVLTLALLGGAVWIFSLPPSPGVVTPPAVAANEARETLTALKPPKRKRPIIAVIGINDATETTDYLMPAGILRRADVADVLLVSTNSGPVRLYPALTVEPDVTTASFDADHPDGADYVIVPAMSRNDDPAAIRWIRDQSAKGATIIGVCVGGLVVAETGLLDGKRATTHWFAVKELREKHPEAIYVADRRIVADEGVATTTGITASMPMTLTLIEAIAGREKAESVARSVGLPEWDARHASSAFRLNRDFALTVMGNVAAFWNREDLGLELESGVDEVSLALAADAWSRTFRSRARTFAASGGSVETMNGFRILPDVATADWSQDHIAPAVGVGPPAATLDDVLASIASRYGKATRDAVALQLEYPKAAETPA